jgi:hypothetical protein
MTKSTKADLSYQALYNARPEVQARRVENNAARRKMIAEGKAHVGDGKDVAHKKAVINGGTNAPENLFMASQKENRGFRRGSASYNPDKKVSKK